MFGHTFLQKFHSLTVFKVFCFLSHVLNPLSHAGATMRQLDTPEVLTSLRCSQLEVLLS